jgi:hypothetical protein
MRAAGVGLLICGEVHAAPALHYGDGGVPLDPVFNLPYDAAQVHFDTIAVSQVGECAPLLGSLGRGTGRVRVFGQLLSGDSRVLILGDENPGAPRGLSGIALVMRNGGCRTSGPLLALRRTKVDDPDLDPGLSAEDVVALLKDLFSRYARAFGSRAAFLTWADRLTYEAECARRAYPDMPCPLLYTSLFTPEMQQALEQFRRYPLKADFNSKG